VASSRHSTVLVTYENSYDLDAGAAEVESHAPVRLRKFLHVKPKPGRLGYRRCLRFFHRKWGENEQLSRRYGVIEVKH